MILLRILEYAFLGVVVILVVTQVVLPLWRGSQLFPFFRRERELEHELQKLKQESIETDLEREIAKTRKDIEKTRKQGGA